MTHVFDLTHTIPDDWNDETKYPNKELVYSTPEDEYTYTIKGHLFNVSNQKDIDDDKVQKSYISMIFELWQYDAPGGGILDNGDKDKTHKSVIYLVKCPQCGSYHIKKSYHNNLNCDALAGSVGIEFRCNECGFNYYQPQIQS